MSATIEQLIRAYGDAAADCGGWDKHTTDETYDEVNGRALVALEVLRDALTFFCVPVDEPIAHLEVPNGFSSAVKVARAYANAYGQSVFIWFSPEREVYYQLPSGFSSRAAKDGDFGVGYVLGNGIYVHTSTELNIRGIKTVNADYT